LINIGVFAALLMIWAVSFAYRRIILPGRREALAMNTNLGYQTGCITEFQKILLEISVYSNCASYKY